MREHTNSLINNLENLKNAKKLSFNKCKIPGIMEVKLPISAPTMYLSVSASAIAPVSSRMSIISTHLITTECKKNVNYILDHLRNPLTKIGIKSFAKNSESSTKLFGTKKSRYVSKRLKMQLNKLSKRFLLQVFNLQDKTKTPSCLFAPNIIGTVE